MFQIQDSSKVPALPNLLVGTKRQAEILYSTLFSGEGFLLLWHLTTINCLTQQRLVLSLRIHSHAVTKTTSSPRGNDFYCSSFLLIKLTPPKKISLGISNSQQNRKNGLAHSPRIYFQQIHILCGTKNSYCKKPVPKLTCSKFAILTEKVERGRKRREDAKKRNTKNLHMTS